MSVKTFNLAAGFATQAQQLKEWQSILKEEVFAKLQNHCKELNEKLIEGTATDCWGKLLPQSGYSVFRGTDMDNWIHNNLVKRLR